MTISVRLSPEDEQRLEDAARQLGTSKHDLARQAIQDLCRKVSRKQLSPYELGKDLFGSGLLAEPPKDPVKRRIYDRLSVKHGRVG